jgi:crotonobetainyl-CoA:carnitine CoA-transferase CaiB-like acyl-CoA transferase
MIPSSALANLRVVDFPRVLAGPYCTMLLADFGASVPLVGPVAKLSATPAQVSSPPPRLGEHTREILSNELGFSADEIERLARENGIGAIES